MSTIGSKSGAEEQRLWKSAGFALGLELLFFLSLGVGHLRFFKNRFDSANYIDAQILEVPANDHLSGVKTTPDDDEVVFHPKTNPPKTVKKRIQKPPEQNQVNEGPTLGPTHGPVALYAPAPIIPAYLRDQNLRTSVVIEFLVTAQGEVAVRLLDSSGSDELDAIALAAVGKWRFKPAAKDNVPVDSRTRLRILFEVD